MSPSQYEAALAAFLRNHSVTRCPTVCAVPTRAEVAEADRAAYREYVAAKEAARLQRLKAVPPAPHLWPAPGL
jgi:hypothetical protein